MAFASAGDKVIMDGMPGTIVTITDDGLAQVAYTLGYFEGTSYVSEDTLTIIDVLDRKWTPSDRRMRREVMQCMHDTGDRYRSITSEEHTHVRILADGFGKLPPSHPAFYDWSHVRDSSPEAIEAMYIRLADMGYADRVR